MTDFSDLESDVQTLVQEFSDERRTLPGRRITFDTIVAAASARRAQAVCEGHLRIQSRTATFAAQVAAEAELFTSRAFVVALERHMVVFALASSIVDHAVATDRIHGVWGHDFHTLCGVRMTQPLLPGQPWRSHALCHACRRTHWWRRVIASARAEVRL